MRAGSTITAEGDEVKALRETSAAAVEVQTSIHRKLSGVERLALALEMSLVARELALARLRDRHPEWSDADLKGELIRYAFVSSRSARGPCRLRIASSPA